MKLELSEIHLSAPDGVQTNPTQIIYLTEKQENQRRYSYSLDWILRTCRKGEITAKSESFIDQKSENP